MIPFRRVLSEGDLRHLRAILGATPDPGLNGKVDRFLRERTFVAEEAEGVFRTLAPAVRETAISELVWRVTCHLDGSVTRVKGVDTFDLGGGFCAVLSEREGREVFCVSSSKAP
jgi:hypothetical protein